MSLAPTRLIAWLAAAGVIAGLAGCASDGGINYASIYEGVFGDERPPTPTQAVAMAFDRGDADERRKGIGWLAASSFGGEDEYMAIYRLFVDDPDPSVRAAAANALGMHGTPADAQLLIVLLADEDPLARWQAADALRKVHNPEAVAALIERLDAEVEEDPDARAAAALALGQYPDRVVFDRLVTALEDRSFTVVNAARRSLVTLTGHDAGFDPRDWGAWSADNAALFTNASDYTYQTYQPTRGWFDRYITFWNNQSDSEGPQRPTGLDAAEGG